jgi:hypothetical protein
MSQFVLLPSSLGNPGDNAKEYIPGMGIVKQILSPGV